MTRTLPEQNKVVCTRCGKPMQLSHTRADSSYKRRFERRTFGCKSCGRQQTYTMDRSSREQD